MYRHIYHPPPPPAYARRDDQALAALFQMWQMQLEKKFHDAPGPVGDPFLTEGIQEVLHLSATEIKELMEIRNVCLIHKPKHDGVFRDPQGTYQCKLCAQQKVNNYLKRKRITTVPCEPIHTSRKEWR